MTFPASLPSPRTPDPRQAPPLRWGILGTGWIAQQFTTALQQNTTQRVTAVGSRSQEGADRFGERFGVEGRHASYADLVADPEVDVIYVATPHNHHHRDALLALRAGKHVLVEKPMTVDADQAREIAREADERGLFAMEALWTLFLPKFDVIRQLIESGVFGRIRTVLADHGQHFDADHRIMDPALAGGPMLDLMTYPASFAKWVIGDPVDVVARTTWAPSGVTGQTAITYTTADEAQALLHSSVLSRTPTTGAICGDAALLEIDGDFYVPGGFTLTDHEGHRLRYDEEEVAHTGGLHFQACEMARRIAAGETSSPLRTLDATIATLAIMDAARAQIGETFAEPSA
ncbi:Gfo/Idh/MocA family protein [Agilicoccus flavus]|uniref:Gfo/Idh/MocA family protein n=1 Tax=Agilicoccus flavus TaxID=2775968 RepID=UPI001CF64F42|nr:Gfo/Idh/MocA family oxidoreductase [Agilicoccus flavus]